MADAMIRGVLGVDPDTLSDIDWARSAHMAEAVEHRRAALQADYIGAKMAELFSKMFKRS